MKCKRKLDTVCVLFSVSALLQTQFVFYFYVFDEAARESVSHVLIIGLCGSSCDVNFVQQIYIQNKKKKKSKKEKKMEENRKKNICGKIESE